MRKAMRNKGCCDGFSKNAHAYGILAAALLAASVVSAHAEGEINFKTAPDAMQQGISAFKSGNFQIAIPALEYAEKRNIFPARYYLARIYGSNSTSLTDHAKAFILLHEFVQAHADTDPADYRKAPIVARAMTRLARYIRDGLPEIGVRADIDRAVEYFHHSATFFDDEDAQFELAKLQLVGDGMHRSQHSALHWLSVLSRKGHPGAQAFLADLNWRGEYTSHNPMRALILIELSIENAPEEDLVWIEDIYQNIFCGVSEDTKTKVSSVLTRWRVKFGRARQERSDLLNSLNIGPQRTCADGQPVHRLSPTVPLEVSTTKKTPEKSVQTIDSTNDSELRYKALQDGYRETSDRIKTSD